MIPKREILEIATNSNLTPHVIEKDYVLGWMLEGIHNHAELKESWAFKGGTCLKKCYFETYRFSEDLDFTLTDKSHINEKFLKGVFAEISDWVYESSGVEIPVDRMIFEICENPRGVMSCQGRLFYRGPNAPQSNKQMPRIKLDLSVDEVIVATPVINLVSHSYSDLTEDGFHIRCYSYEEVFAEKIRALGERTRPRDLYDVINFYRRPESEERSPAVNNILQQKCKFKDIKIPTYAALEKHREDCASGWQQKLSPQLQALPPFESYWDELPGFLEWLNSPESVAPRTREIIPSKPGTIVDNTPIDLRSLDSGTSQLSLLNRIRFAAANHLCVELVYRKEDGEQNTYIIEPYSLRRTSDNNLLLYSMKHGTADDGRPRAFRTDRIISAKATDKTFTPKYMVEFLPSCPVNTSMPVSSGKKSLGLT
ncbi:MAG: nucleotidyl transferase AbiEii/AbiGii toxin family protein [bacterium]|nr:nucleotidyl transferase AbiEii/AbiGii toxin family protein [bacterium]